MPRRALRPGRRLPRVRGRRRRARVRRGLRPPVRRRDGGQDRDAGARAQPRAAHRAAAGRPAARGGGPEGDHDGRQRAPGPRAALRAAAGRRGDRARPWPRRGSLEPGHLGQPRRLHPVRPLRARLRRHPGQRCDRPLRQGLRDTHRLRPQRPDGRVVLRHVRRVRRCLPDRGADEQADQRGADPPALRAAPGRVGLPVLRRGLRADVQRRRRAQGDRLRRRTGTAGVA